MYLTSASLLLSVTWVLWTWAYAAHRRPVPLAWTRNGAASTAIVLLVVALLPLGLGSLFAAGVAPMEALREQTLASAVATLTAPVLAILVTPRLRRPLTGGTGRAAQ